MKMHDYLTLGSTPCEEDCAQVGSENYYEKAYKECHRYIELLKVMFPNIPEKARYAVKAFPHDFGTYHEVIIWYDTEDAPSMDYAFGVENNLPMTWGG